MDCELLSKRLVGIKRISKDITPDMDLTFTFISEFTGDETDMDIPLNVEFFFPRG